MMTKKYFFFDIDGTLTNRETGEMVPSAEEALVKLMKAGHFVSLATGRAFYKAEIFRAKHNIPNMVCNGGHGIFYDGRLRENRPIDYEKALIVYDEAIELGYGVYVALDDSAKVYANSFRFFEQAGLRKEPTIYNIDENFHPSNHPEIYKLYISIPKEEEERLKSRNYLGYVRFEKDYLIFQPDVKDEGIFKMLEYAGGSPKDTVVFGDDDNDLCMFDKRFYKIAMGNACEKLKEKADFVTKKSVEDGIYYACIKHGWI